MVFSRLRRLNRQKGMKTMSADKPVYYVAIDDGFAAMKLIGERPDGSVQYMEFPSIIRSGSDRAMASVFGDNNRIGYYQTEEGIFFTVSKDIVGDGTRIPDFHISQMNRVLVNHALMAAGYGGLDVVVMVLRRSLRLRVERRLCLTFSMPKSAARLWLRTSTCCTTSKVTLLIR
jgi:hypothetical protein